MPIFALAVPWYSYVGIDYLHNIGLTYDKSYWEVLLGLLMMSIMWLNAFYGVVLIIKLILTPNKNEETNTNPQAD